MSVVSATNITVAKLDGASPAFAAQGASIVAWHTTRFAVGDGSGAAAGLHLSESFFYSSLPSFGSDDATMKRYAKFCSTAIGGSTDGNPTPLATALAWGGFNSSLPGYQFRGALMGDGTVVTNGVQLRTVVVTANVSAAAATATIDWSSAGLWHIFCPAGASTSLTITSSTAPTDVGKTYKFCVSRLATSDVVGAPTLSGSWGTSRFSGSDLELQTNNASTACLDLYEGLVVDDVGTVLWTVKRFSW
jgi:hypothetical protein